MVSSSTDDWKFIPCKSPPIPFYAPQSCWHEVLYEWQTLVAVGGVCRVGYVWRGQHGAWHPFKFDVWFDWKLSFGLPLLVGFCPGHQSSGTFAGRKGNLFGIEIWFFQCLRLLRLCSSGANFINPKWLIKAKWRHFSKQLRELFCQSHKEISAVGYLY